MRAALCLLGAMVLTVGVAPAEDPYWVTPMQQVHATYTGSGHTISRFGDSISYSGAFFKPLRYAHANTTAEDNAALGWVRNYLSTPCWDWQNDNFQFLHGCDSGKTSSWPLEAATASWPGYVPGERKVDYWLRRDNPEMAVIMWGTNDVHNGPALAGYITNMREVVVTCKDNGTIPILTTIPPRRSYVTSSEQYAQAMRDLAVEQQVPLIEYRGEILTRRPTTWDGTLISGDGVHPSNTAPTQDFSETMLSTNGYTLRNWVTVHKCYEVYDLVIDAPPWEPVELVHSIRYLGDGVYGYTFSIDSHDQQQDSYAVLAAFDGENGATVQQMKAIIDPGVEEYDVHTEGDAATYDGLGTPPYDKDRDSYFLEPFASSSGVTFTESTNYYSINADTGAGSAHEDVDLGYIVASGDLGYNVMIMRQGELYTFNGTVQAPVPGDADGNGQVDGADYTRWADNYQQTGKDWSMGDFDGDGVVTGADYTIWADHFTGGGAPVPEPGTLVCLLLGGLFVRARRRRRGAEQS